MTLARILKTIVLVAVIATASLTGRNAEAQSIGDVVNGLRKAYEAYQKYRGGQHTLEQATADVLAGIDEATSEIMATRNTSRAVGQALLPVITAPPPQPPVVIVRPIMRVWAF